MKKIYSSFLLAAMMALPTGMTNAQQLPNASFEDGWTDCVPWTSDGKTVKCGKTPSSWTIAHVAGTGASGTGKTVVGEQVEGRTGAAAIKVVNSPNSVASTQTVPGYFSLGKSWNTGSSLNLANTKDGGTFGGYENFTYRPDAVEFYYKRSHGTANASEKATILAYLWKGQTTQANVPGTLVIFGSIKTTNMVDRDRNILDISTSQGGAVTKSNDFERIAKFQYDLTGDAADWTRLEIPLTYESTAAPTKINVLFSAGDYFSTNPGVNNELIVDDVKLLYFSRLASLSIGGTPLEGFDSNTYTYNVDTEMPAESAFAFTTLGNSGSASATVALDAANAVATITVTNSNAGGEDADGQTSHVYTIQFKKSEPAEPTESVYSGTLTIDMGSGDLTEGKGKGDVHIIDYGNGTCDFLLPDFTLPMGDESYNLGDIKVEGLTKTTADGVSTYTGSKNGLTLTLGTDAIVANVVVNGTIDAEGNAHMVINVKWIMTPDLDPTDENYMEMPIEVVFNGKEKTNERPEEVYNGYISVDMGYGDVTEGEGRGEVHIFDNGDGTSDFVLPNFTLPMGEGSSYELGDIVVEGLTKTVEGDKTTYRGSKTGLKLMNDAIYANVTVNGTVEANGKVYMTIGVIWVVDPDLDPSDELYEEIPIAVIFSTEKITAAIDDITTDLNDANAPVEYYNLQGVRVAADNLTPGIYVVRQGNKVSKVYVK